MVAEENIILTQNKEIVVHNKKSTYVMVALETGAVVAVAAAGVVAAMAAAAVEAAAAVVAAAVVEAAAAVPEAEIDYLKSKNQECEN